MHAIYRQEDDHDSGSNILAKGKRDDNRDLVHCRRNLGQVFVDAGDGELDLVTDALFGTLARARSGDADK